MRRPPSSPVGSAKPFRVFDNVVSPNCDGSRDIGSLGRGASPFHQEGPGNPSDWLSRNGSLDARIVSGVKTATVQTTDDGCAGVVIAAQVEAASVDRGRLRMLATMTRRQPDRGDQHLN